MAESYQTIAVEVPADRVQRVTLSRESALNALNTQMAAELAAHLSNSKFEADDIRCVIVTGRGERAFCAGGDLKERHGMTDEAWFRQHKVFEQLFMSIASLPVPVIAAVNGVAYGGGCEIAAMCDFIYASTNARFALPEVTLGIMPGGGGTQTLARAVGERRAKELIFTGLPFSAQEAREWGLVNAVLPPDELQAAVLRAATRIAKKSAPIGVRHAKRAISTGMPMPLRDALLVEIEAYNHTVISADRREGVDAFIAKRAAVFRGA
jgi:enoyl-CoA hydratase/carnithine racemase